MPKYVVLATFERQIKGWFGRTRPTRMSLWQAGVDFETDAMLLYHYGDEAQARGVTLVSLQYAPWNGVVPKPPIMGLNTYLPPRSEERAAPTA